MMPNVPNTSRNFDLNGAEEGEPKVENNGTDKMATLTRRALKLGAVAGTVPAACIALGYRMRAVQASENSSQEGSRVYRACDLPIYTVNKSDNTSLEDVYPRNSVEETIGNVRRTIQDFVGQYKGTYEDAKHKVETGVEHSKSTLDFVQNNPGELPRVAFITVGSLGGFILGYRGSIVRRVIYGSVAGVSCAALCYPQFTVNLSQQAGQQVSDAWRDFSMEELKKGNWPFLQDESVDEENRKKLGLPKDTSFVKELSGDASQSAAAVSPVQMKGDPGQGREEDKDMYSTRSS